MFFDDEHKALHLETDQLKRQKTALKLPLDTVDLNAKTAKIGKYSISLDGCTCVDFAMRRKPCKHMYRLAYELGTFSPSSAGLKTVVSYVNAGEVDSQRKELKAQAEKLPHLAQLLLHEILLKHTIKTITEQTAEMTKILVNAGLLKRITVNDMSKEEVCKEFTVKQLQQIAPYTIRGKTRKAIIDSLVDGSPDMNAIRETLSKRSNDANSYLVFHIWPKEYENSRIAVLRSIGSKEFSDDDYYSIGCEPPFRWDDIV